MTIPDALYENMINSEYYNTYDCVLVTRSISCYDVIYIEYDEDLYFYYTGRLYSSKNFNGVFCAYSTDGKTLNSTNSYTNYSLNWMYCGTTSDNTYNFYLKNLSLATDANKSGFFFKTPLTETPETIPATVEIPKLETVEQIPETIITTLKLIIPVGLVILSMVLVIYLVRYEIYRFL